jgi:hypothetical protein
VTCSISSVMVSTRTGTSKPFDGKVDYCNDQYGRYEFFYTHCLMYVVEKEVYNNELVESMMTSRKVEVEVPCDNTAKPFLRIPHPTLSVVCLAICRTMRISSIGRPSHHFDHLKAGEKARRGVAIASGVLSQAFDNNQVTFTIFFDRSHLITLSR